jgi:hypothetical protein
MRWWDIEEFDDCDIFDPVRVERSPKVEDAEAAVFEAICHSASPGPFVIDDQASGEGIVVASLPDGRLIVSIDAPKPSEEDGEIQAEANARLFCEARCMILRLLRDREQWYEHERDMLDRIAVLESRLAKLEHHDMPPDRGRFDSYPYPR